LFKKRFWPVYFLFLFLNDINFMALDKFQSNTSVILRCFGFQKKVKKMGGLRDEIEDLNDVRLLMS